MLMDANTKDPGIATCAMEKALNAILMETLTTVISRWEKLMVRVFTHGLMAKSMMESGIWV